MKEQEKVIEKIKKILELAKNNPSEEEAKSAALKAQKLMAEYHVDMHDIESIEDINEITETCVTVGTGNKWKYRLANVIAKNFRCKCYYLGKTRVVFYGYEADSIIASDVYKFLFNYGVKASNSFYNKMRNQALRDFNYFSGYGIKNSFLYGFTEGIKEVLDNQCTALMIVVPPKVKESYEEKTKAMKRIDVSIKIAGDNSGKLAENEGRKKGREVMQKSITANH